MTSLGYCVRFSSPPLRSLNCLPHARQRNRRYPCAVHSGRSVTQADPHAKQPHSRAPPIGTRDTLPAHAADPKTSAWRERWQNRWTGRRRHGCARPVRAAWRCSVWGRSRQRRNPARFATESEPAHVAVSAADESPDMPAGIGVAVGANQEKVKRLI